MTKLVEIALEPGTYEVAQGRKLRVDVVEESWSVVLQKTDEGKFVLVPNDHYKETSRVVASFDIAGDLKVSEIALYFEGQNKGTK